MSRNTIFIFLKNTFFYCSYGSYGTSLSDPTRSDLLLPPIEKILLGRFHPDSFKTERLVFV